MWNEFLELLARDAAAVEFEGPVLTARARGEPPDVVEELEQGKRLALQVRDTLSTRLRREVQLTALYETAGDLARLGDLDSVLEAIVRRARQLLGTDIAYLTMNDPDAGDTYMRVTDGSTSARFQQLRLGMGEGLGGLVAQTGLPYVTASYRDDKRFHHTDAIDTAVDEEGLVAIVGVPLQMGTRVIGVLYAANRTERPFSREDITLLLSLAAHAAVAIDKARLLDETRRALAELNSTNVLLREHTRAVERAAAAHDRMAQIVLGGGGVEELAHSVTEVIGGSLLVLDDHSAELARVGDVEELPPDTLAQALADARAGGRAVHRSGRWVAAVAAGGQHLGALVLGGRPALDDADQRILERAAVVTSLLLVVRRSGIEAESRLRGELLEDLLRRPGTDLTLVTERARRVGADLCAPYSLYVADVGAADRQRAVLAANHVARTRGGLSGSFDGRVVLLLPDSDPGAGARKLAAELGAAVGTPVTVGGAGPTLGPDQVAPTYQEAMRCGAALRNLRREGQGADARELGFVGLVLSGEPDLRRFVDATLGPVLEYDARRGTELVATLEAYFGCGGNLARTHQALHVHVNTVAQRLERIAQLIGEDWQEPDRVLELQLALRLHRLAEG